MEKLPKAALTPQCCHTQGEPDAADATCHAAYVRRLVIRLAFVPLSPCSYTRVVRITQVRIVTLGRCAGIAGRRGRPPARLCSQYTSLCQGVRTGNIL